MQGGITSDMPGGAFVGSIASGFLSDKMGRKYSIQTGALIWFVSSILDTYAVADIVRLIGCTLSCASQNIGMLIVGRFVNGNLSGGVDGNPNLHSQDWPSEYAAPRCPSTYPRLPALKSEDVS